MKSCTRLVILSIVVLLLGGLAGSEELPATEPVAESRQVPNWPAPLFWKPPAVARVPSEASTEAIDTAPSPLPFIALTPCRLVNTRGTAGVPINTGGSFSANEIRTWTFTGLCGIPPSAAAVSLNVTVTSTQASPFGFVTVWPAGTSEPNVSALNWSTGGATESNAAIVPLGQAAARG